MAWWRDVDSERGKIGVIFWRAGAEMHIGRRLYRVRWVGLGTPVAVPDDYNPNEGLRR